MHLDSTNESHFAPPPVSKNSVPVSALYQRYHKPAASLGRHSRSITINVFSDRNGIYCAPDKDHQNLVLGLIHGSYCLPI